MQKGDAANFEGTVNIAALTTPVTIPTPTLTDGKEDNFEGVPGVVKQLCQLCPDDPILLSFKFDFDTEERIGKGGQDIVNLKNISSLIASLIDKVVKKAEVRAAAVNDPSELKI